MTERFGDRPRFSVVVPLHDSDPAHLVAMLRSWQDQSWTGFECVLVDDGSTSGTPFAIARAVADHDHRFRVVARASNGGIAAATNDAIARTTGQWVVFCDHDDLVDRQVLNRIARHLALHPGLELVYTDEAVVDVHGAVVSEHRKPDLSPERLLGQNYVAHLVAVRRDLLDRVARRPGRWVDRDFEPCQDNDLLLRCTELASAVGHLPVVSYHWRAGASSLAASADRKEGVARAVVAACTAALARRDDPAEVEPIDGSPTTVRVHRPMPAGARTLHVPIRPDDTAAEVQAAQRERRAADPTDPRSLHVVFTPSDALRTAATGPGGRVLADPYEPLVAQSHRHGASGPLVVTDDARIVSAGRAHRPHLHDLGSGLPADHHGPWGAYLVAREAASLSPLGFTIRADVLDTAGGLLGTGHAGRGDAVPDGITLDAAVTALCARLRRSGRAPVWTPLTTVVVPSDHLADERRRRRRDAELERLLPTHPELLDDPYDPTGVHPRHA